MYSSSLRHLCQCWWIESLYWRLQHILELEQWTGLSLCELTEARTRGWVCEGWWALGGGWKYSSVRAPDRMTSWDHLGFLKRHGLSCTPALYEGTAGSAIVTGLHVSPTRATAVVAVSVGGGGGGWHTWTVCPRGMHHIQHSLSPLLPPQYSTPPPPLEWVSSACWQQWQAQHRETMGGG